jgi:hypothetical protein
MLMGILAYGKQAFCRLVACLYIKSLISRNKYKMYTTEDALQVRINYEYVHFLVY